MSDDGERLDGGARSVIGSELGETHGGRKDGAFAHGYRQRRMEADLAGRNGPVDPGAAPPPHGARGKAGIRPPEMSVEEFRAVSDYTDAQVQEAVAAIAVYRAQGYSYGRVGTVMGVPTAWVRRMLAVARERRLALPALDAARTYVEDHLVDQALDTVGYHLRRKNLEAALGTLRGVGVLRNSDTPVDGRLPMQLNVQIVDADGVVISVGGRAPKLPGVMGVPKAALVPKSEEP